MLRAVILAGGLGSRIRHLIPGIPKPMVPILGRPFCEWVVRWLVAQGISQFAVATGYLGENIAAHFSRSPIAGAHIDCHQEFSPLGTGGGLVDCVRRYPSAVNDIWIVANGDSLVLANINELVESVRSGAADAAILGLFLADAGRYGSLEVDHCGRLKSFCEKRPGAATINAGLYVFSGRVFEEMPETRPLSLEADIFPSLVATRRVAVHCVEAPFLDIGTPETLPLAEEFVRDNFYKYLRKHNDLPCV